MFEELDGFLEKNRKPTKKKKADPEKGIFDELSKETRESVYKGNMPDSSDIEKMLGRILPKGSFSIMEDKSHVDTSIMEIMHRNMKVYGEAIEGLQMQMVEFGKKLKLKPWCFDSQGKELKVGDILLARGSDTKKVLAVHFGAAELSHSDDHSKTDGLWSQFQINNRKFKKQ